MSAERVDVEVRGGTMQDVESAEVGEHGVLEVVDRDGARYQLSPHYWLQVTRRPDPR